MARPTNQQAELRRVAAEQQRIADILGTDEHGNIRTRPISDLKKDKAGRVIWDKKHMSLYLEPKLETRLRHYMLDKTRRKRTNAVISEALDRFLIAEGY